MHSLYSVTALDNGKFRYTTSGKDQVPLFGCNSGIICRMLARTLVPTDQEPKKWDIDVRRGLAELGHQSIALVIDLKPNAADKNVSLYELVRVWGVSAAGWTPVMLHLRGLLVDQSSDKFRKEDFEVDMTKVDDPIMSFSYRNGSVADGKLIGKWTSSGSSAANSVMLWPETMEYFMREARAVLDKTRAGK